MSNHSIWELCNLPPVKKHKDAEDLVDSTRTVGIELEVENVSFRRVTNELGGRGWSVVPDGSLRPRDRSAEIITEEGGLAGQALVDSISRIDDAPSFKSGTFGWRCGMHVHVDVRDKNLEDFRVLAVLHCLMEPSLFLWDGFGRNESRFCMPWSVCMGDMSTLTQGYKGSMAAKSKNGDFSRSARRFSKYTSLNVKPLVSLGTIEFRHAQSTRDPERVLEYVNLCLAIVRGADASVVKDPCEPIGFFLEHGYFEFVRKYLGNRAVEAMRKVNGDLQSETERTIDTALTAGYLYQLT